MEARRPLRLDRLDRHELGEHPPPAAASTSSSDDSALDLRDALATVRERQCRHELDPLAHDRRARGGGGLLERDGHLAGRDEAVARVAREPLHDDAVELGRQARDEIARRVDQAVQDVREHGRLVVGVEEALGGDDLPQHDRRRVDVGATGAALPAQDLGGDVRELPFELPLARDLHAIGRLGDAEVDDARGAVDADEHVLRRDVPVHDAERLPLVVLRFVRSVQPAEDAAEDGHGDRQRDPFSCRAIVAFISRDRESPSTYSMTRKTSSSTRRTSSGWTTFGWRMRAARRASARNMSTNSSIFPNCGCSRLMATIFEKPPEPTWRPKCTVAIPPAASSP